MIYLGIQLIISVVCLWSCRSFHFFSAWIYTDCSGDPSELAAVYTCTGKIPLKEVSCCVGNSLARHENLEKTDRLTYWHNVTMQISYCTVGTTCNKCFVAFSKSIWCDPSLFSFLLSMHRKRSLLRLSCWLLGKIREEGLKNMLHTSYISCPQEPQIALLFFQNIYITVVPRGSS